MAQTSKLKSQLDFLHNPALNKGTAFTDRERDMLKLRGLLPPMVEDISRQVKRVMDQIHNEEERDLDKYFILQQLMVTNETLYFRVLEDNLPELLPIVYTPTVGVACMKFDRIYKASTGMYFSAFADSGEIRKLLDNWPYDDVEIIVVTDGGRILGLGDLGTNGMGISIGKISLYVAGGGFDPRKAMPVCLDMGTDRRELIEDEFYLGAKSPRLHGKEHMDFVEEFCLAVKDKWPHSLIQFEDFKTGSAFTILENLREKMPCFNDDIQGTGAVVVAGFVNGMKVQKTDLKEAKVVFYGAGSSACGVAAMIASLLMSSGLSKEDAYKAIYLVDTKGLVTTSRGDQLPKHKEPFARSDGTPNMNDLCEIIDHAKPHALFGLSGAGAAFTRDVVKALCRSCSRPLIFPLSNPTERAEITAEDAYSFSEGKCIFAAGSPFKPVTYEGKTFYPGQANNVYVFPGIGFGAVTVKATKVPDEFFVAAAKALADYTSEGDLEAGKVYPSLHELRDISATIAAAVGIQAYEMGLARLERPKDLGKFIRDKMYEATY